MTPNRFPCETTKDCPHCGTCNGLPRGEPGDGGEFVLIEYQCQSCKTIYNAVFTRERNEILVVPYTEEAK